MAAIKRFEDLEVWKTARILTNMVYELTDEGIFAQDYGLKQQIQRAAVSIMSNIAEGFESQTQSLFISFLARAKGSAGEVRSQLYIALDRKYISEAEFNQAFNLARDCSRQLHGFMEYLKSQPNISRVREEPSDFEMESSIFNIQS